MTKETQSFDFYINAPLIANVELEEYSLMLNIFGYFSTNRQGAIVYDEMLYEIESAKLNKKFIKCPPKVSEWVARWWLQNPNKVADIISKELLNLIQIGNPRSSSKNDLTSGQ